MNLKIKKRVISMLCATVMGASSMGASVGAINTVPNCTQKSKDAVSKLDKTLECSTDGLMKLNDNIQKLKSDNPNNNEVENIIAKLSGAIKKINNWSGYYIADENLIVEIQNEITNLNNQIIDLNNQITKLNSKCLSEQPNLVIQNSTAICDKIETINNKLLEENSKVLFQKKLDNRYNEYYSRVEEFCTWRDGNDIREGLDTIYTHIRYVAEYYKLKRKNADASVVKEFSELATNVYKEMEEFKNRKALIWKELDNKYNEHCKQVREFRRWKDRYHISQGLDTMNSNALYVAEYYISTRRNADASVVEEFSKLTKKLRKEINEFRSSKFSFWRELDNTFTEYTDQVGKFLKWRADNYISKLSDTTRENRLNVVRYYSSNKKNADAGVVEEFFKLAKKSYEEMEEFKSRKAFFWKELDDKYKEYCSKVEEFRRWKDSNNISQGLDTIHDNISYVETYYTGLRPEANAAVLNRFSELITRSYEEMEKFRDQKLENDITKIKNSSESTRQKIEKIINILKNNPFNNYHKQLNIILPIVDSLHIADDDNADIAENRDLRNQLKEFLVQSVEKKIDEKIKAYYENEITKPMAEYINNRKHDIADTSANIVITATFHGRYVNETQLFDIVDMNLSSCEEDFQNSDIDKNIVKNIDHLNFVKLLYKISNENYVLNYNNEVKKLDRMLRQYAKRITGMETRLETEDGYGENAGEELKNDELMDLSVAIYMWEVDNLADHYNNLADHYIRDRIVKDNLVNVLQQYKPLNDFATKIRHAMIARIVNDGGIGDRRENKRKLEEAVNDAGKALNDLQQRVTITENNEFMIVEN